MPIVSKNCKNFISNILKTDINERFDIITALNSAFIKNNNIYRNKIIINIVYILFFDLLRF